MSEKVLLNNKRARFDYQIIDTLEAGMVLQGGEVKSLRAGSGSLAGSYVQILEDKRVVLLGAHINPYKFADNRDYDPDRTRHLLLKKKQIDSLSVALSQKGLSLIPLSIIARESFIKLQIGLCRGKKQFEKREVIKKRDSERQIRRFVR
ncbi:SsrA-binding protein SmpB [Microgenomates group bacterium]|nr:SsrA-binding protein SmpB [Microgenomates group bacterium]